MARCRHGQVPPCQRNRVPLEFHHASHSNRLNTIHHPICRRAGLDFEALGDMALAEWDPPRSSRADHAEPDCLCGSDNHGRLQSVEYHDICPFLCLGLFSPWIPGVLATRQYWNSVYLKFFSGQSRRHNKQQYL